MAKIIDGMVRQAEMMTVGRNVAHGLVKTGLGFGLLI